MTAHEAGRRLIFENYYTLLECRIQFCFDTLTVKYSKSVKPKQQWLQLFLSQPSYRSGWGKMIGKTQKRNLGLYFLVLS